MTLSVTTEFHAEFEAEREVWLRDRFMWYCGFMASIGLLFLIIAFVSLGTLSDALSGNFIAKLLVRGGQLALFGGAMAYVSTRRRDMSRQRVLRILSFCIITIGVIGLFAAPALAATFNAFSSDSADQALSFGPGASWLVLLLITHGTASLFIPWSPSEAMRPMTPLLLLASGLFVFSGIMGWDSWIGVFLGIMFAWMISLPGLTISWLRHSQYRKRFHLRALAGRYGAIKRELVDARRIHESLFPPQVLDGHVRFAYRYEPMLQLGGDFVFLHPRPKMIDGPPVSDPSQPMSVVLIDVTGHGIGAALTVNRLDGELHRLFAEDPKIGPGAVIEALNKYIHLTLAEHSVYATAFAARVCPEEGEVQWANAGHPPGMLRDAAGRVEELISTTFVLGAAAPEDYAGAEETRRFGPGDTLLLYTDGAFEVRNNHGTMFTLDGIRRSLVRGASTPAGKGDLAQRLLDDVDDFRSGPPSDDTLILEIARAVSHPARPVTRRASSAATHR